MNYIVPLQKGLKGQNFRDVLRLYLGSLVLLSFPAIFIGSEYGSEVLYKVTPVLVGLLVAYQYVVLYRHKYLFELSALIQDFKLISFQTKTSQGFGLLEAPPPITFYALDFEYKNIRYKMTTRTKQSIQEFLNQFCSLGEVNRISHSNDKAGRAPRVNHADEKVRKLFKQFHVHEKHE